MDDKFPPIPKGKKVIEEAWNYEEKAEECYRQWNTKGVYGNCREEARAKRLRKKREALLCPFARLIKIPNSLIGLTS